MTPQTKSKPGRPKAEEPSTRLTTWIPTRIYDAIADKARKDDRSVSSLVRERLDAPR
jgi:hypothetical protein